MRKVFAILFLSGLIGCGTQPKLSEIVNDMVVLTNYETNIDFSQYSTYALTMDTIGLISNTTSDNSLGGDYARIITAQIKKNLDQSGRTQVDKEDTPDLGVNVTVVDDLSVTQSIIYPGYYYPSAYGYSGYYGYGGGGYVTTNYFQQGILVIELVDLKTPSAGDPAAVWVANIGDLYNSYDPSTKTKEAIDQAFVQSGYLDR